MQVKVSVDFFTINMMTALANPLEFFGSRKRYI